MGNRFSYSRYDDRATEGFRFADRSHALVVRRRVVEAYNDGLDREKRITERAFADEYSKFDAERMTLAFERVGVPVSLWHFAGKAIHHGPARVHWEPPSVGEVLSTLDVVRTAEADKERFGSLVASSPRRHGRGAPASHPIRA